MTATDIEPITLRRVATMVLRVPLAEPIPTAFGGRMDARVTLLVRLEDAEGAVGWGEVWCNFPTFGAEHRALLMERIIAPLVLSQPLVPAEAAAALERRLHTLSLQTGEFGPLAQVLGGFDMALWDLAGRRAGVPTHRLMGSTVDAVPAYASGINPTRPDETVRAAQAVGFRAFKLKVGFGRERDLENAAAVARCLRPGEVFVVDANQAWSVEEACQMAEALAPLGPRWLEEPLPADATPADWKRVASVGVPLAAGENMRGLATFVAALAEGWLSVAQPDAGKWGGLSGGLKVARRALGAGRRFCPHHLAGAIGLTGAAHLLAASGGDGVLETDVNDNPLRSVLAGPLPGLVDGRWPLADAPGLGLSPDRVAIAAWVAREGEVCAGSV
ncbi:mandelate racemase/muconate lactonizing enzyme family protein [Acuticoccus mangrovi]|uniref:Mandelate racemase/muconate lactonizing enzyme family protein n=1 Tax=Acuticoccus mangrovi TaxID=2796142 RepID=A0A934IGM6_9HYPH|nr:mandelate racemase/muconate lactonizing enzyme family protein [Acuticoccus mangrovi]MBJ3774631.1 mandelate racemase/muconate lactonizing enzyme family protein [Acuticoccus mangrovi]